MPAQYPQCYFGNHMGIYWKGTLTVNLTSEWEG